MHSEVEQLLDEPQNNKIEEALHLLRARKEETSLKFKKLEEIAIEATEGVKKELEKWRHQGILN